MTPRWPIAVAWSVAGALACAGAPQPVGVPRVSRAERGVSAAPAAVAPALQRWHLPHVHTERLPNGMTLLIVKKATPVARLALSVRNASATARAQPSAGRRPERLTAAVLPPAVLPPALSTAVSTGAGSSLLGDIEERGGSLQLETAREHSLLSATVLTSDISHSLERLAAWVGAGVDRRGAADAAPGAPGTDTPRLLPSDTALIVVGDVRPARVSSLVRELFGPWGGDATPRPRRTEPTGSEPSGAGPRIVLVDRPGATESTLVAWQPMPARTAPGHEAREVMAHALGGLFNSRLNLSLRERHALSYGCSARLLAGRAGGTLVVSTRVATLRTAAALREVMLELNAVSDAAGAQPFTEGEIETAKRQVLMSIELEAEHAGGIVALLSEAHAAELPWQALVDYPARLSRVDRGAVQREVGRVDPRAMTVVITGNRAHIEAEIHVVAAALSRLLARE